MAVAKRILLYILAAVLSVGFIVPSVSAEEANGANKDIINAFSANGEYIVKNSNGSNLTFEPIFTGSSSTSRDNSLLWYTEPIVGDYLYFCINTQYSPTSFVFDGIQVKINGSAKVVNYEWGGSYQYFYSVKLGNSAVNSIEIIYDSNGYAFDLVLSSCFITKSQLHPAAFVTMELAGLMLNKTDGYTVDTYVFDTRSGTLPMFMSHDYPGSESAWVLADGLCSLTFADLSPYPTDCMYINVLTAGSLINSGAYLVDEDGNRIQNIDVLAEYTGTPLDTSQRFHGRPLNAYLLSIDLTGIELRGYDLVVTYGINEVQFSASQYDTAIYTYVQSAFVKYTSEEVPWYTRLAFYFENLGNKIVAGIREVFTSESAESAANDLESAEDQLEELTPTFDNEEIISNAEDIVNEYLPEEDLLEIGADIKDLFYVLPPLYYVLPFTLALVSYLLYGKRS